MEKCCRYIEEFKETGNLNGDITAYASYHGHLDCLRYAHENGCPWYEFTTSNSSGKGYFECLKYAHENGCPWDKDTILFSAYKGHFDCLKYAHDNGCPWNERETLSYLVKYASTIDLDDMWWRTFLFNKDLTNYTSLQMLVNSKKEEIKQLQLNSEILFSYVSKDVIKYILWSYF